MADLKDFLNQYAPGINNLMQNPFYQDAVIQQQKNIFQDKLKSYNKKRFNLTNKEIDSLILSIASGKNTYKDFQDVIPAMNSPTMCYYLIDKPQVGPNQFETYNLIGPNLPRSTYFQFEEVPEDFFYLYEFKPTDTFILNIPGENRLYELQKEQESLKLTQQSISSANAAVFWAKVSVIISISLFVLGKLLG